MLYVLSSFCWLSLGIRAAVFLSPLILSLSFNVSSLETLITYFCVLDFAHAWKSRHMIVLKLKWFLLLPFFFLSSFQKVLKGVLSVFLDSPKTSHFRKCTLTPHNPPPHRQVCLLAYQTCFLGREVANLFGGGYLPSTPPSSLEARATTWDRGRKEIYAEVLLQGAGASGFPGQLQVSSGDRKTCEDGNYTEAREKTVDLGWVRCNWRDRKQEVNSPQGFSHHPSSYQVLAGARLRELIGREGMGVALGRKYWYPTRELGNRDSG